MTWARVASLVLAALLTCCVSQVAAQATVPQRIRVSEDALRGVLVRKVSPIYPPLARQARIQGTVILKVVIDKSGNVYDVQLVSGHPLLAPAAIDAVKQWKYKPYLLNGEPVEVETNVQVIFKLEGEPAPAAPQLIQLTPAGTGPPREATPHRIRVSSGVAQGLLVSKVNPEYPPEACKQHVQGVVFLKVNIDKEGNVSNVKLIDGHPLLSPSAIDAVKQWKYRPYLLNGEASRLKFKSISR
jgi:TonB family protein